VAKKQQNLERKAIADTIRREQARKERMRRWSILAACGLVVAILIGLALTNYLKNRNAGERIAGAPFSEIGVSRAAAACTPIHKVTYASPASRNHVPNGTPLTYPDSPPAFGKHWANPMSPTEYRTFYTPTDRPAKELLVHSLEHGYTVIWYDETLAANGAAVADLKDIAAKYPLGDHVVIAPWTSKDGTAFPGGSHLALTHWTGPSKQQGVWEYCGKVSGAVAAECVSSYPKTNSPEPAVG
jgi:hypothetical protein